MEHCRRRIVCCVIIYDREGRRRQVYSVGPLGIDIVIEMSSITTYDVKGLA